MTESLLYLGREEGPVRYYSDKLSAARLKMVYEIAPPRVRQYLRAEINYVRSKIDPEDLVLDLGCGYGRVLPELSWESAMTVGIDTSFPSLRSANDIARILRGCHVLQMDAVRMGFRDHSFDKVICIQNGISAFQVDPRELIRESVRVTRPGGLILISTYSARFWEHRLEWFRMQSAAGLLGEIDNSRTCGGVIICRDGFRATTVTPTVAGGLALPSSR